MKPTDLSNQNNTQDFQTVGYNRHLKLKITF
jgi:hypothetical protein